jgi:CDP-diacylglycerol--glycerol-3-phosphate 3-phosphatidyltransferase
MGCHWRKKMNTPNKLTIARIALVPIFMAFLLSQMPHYQFIAAFVFGIASITDLIDGKLARKYNEITDFGKFLDPLADKILVSAALICFVQLGLIDAWIAWIIITREFLVTSLRLVAAGGGKVIAANSWGKAKTASQITAVLVVLACSYFKYLDIQYINNLKIVGDITIWIAALLTIVSGITYIWVHRDYIKAAK